MKFYIYLMSIFLAQISLVALEHQGAIMIKIFNQTDKVWVIRNLNTGNQFPIKGTQAIIFNNLIPKCAGNNHIYVGTCTPEVSANFHSLIDLNYKVAYRGETANYELTLGAADYFSMPDSRLRSAGYWFHDTANIYQQQLQILAELILDGKHLELSSLKIGRSPKALFDLAVSATARAIRAKKYSLNQIPIAVKAPVEKYLYEHYEKYGFINMPIPAYNHS